MTSSTDKILRVTTRAKVNLHLEVMRRRQDGFHEVETIMQSIGLSDEMDVTARDDGVIDLTCTNPEIPVDDTNLCHRAVVAMRGFAGPSLGATIVLRKNIPHGAGLGGGSANAAGVMLALARARFLEIAPDEMAKAAAALGSDVPFMLRGGTMLGRGRGEILTPLASINSGYFLIVKPDLNISTASVYANYSFRLTKHRARINLKSVNAVLARFPRATLSFRNALEDVVCPAHPVIANALDELLSERPCFASMTGSGSALFAVFERREQAEETAERFSVKGFFTSIVEPAKRAVDIN